MASRGQPGRAARRQAALERDGARCVWCGSAFDRLRRPTTEHLVPRLKGGPSWAENEAAACRRCNRERGHRSPSDWLEECRRRGWPVDASALVRRMEDLDAQIRRRVDSAGPVPMSLPSSGDCAGPPPEGLLTARAACPC